MIRKITPHKGGRPVKLSARCSLEIKRKLDEIQLKDGASLGDLIQRWVDVEYSALGGTKTIMSTLTPEKRAEVTRLLRVPTPERDGETHSERMARLSAMKKDMEAKDAK